MRMRKFAFVATLCLLSGTSLTGCSVGMAMSGDNNPDLSQVAQGATRGEVEMQLGAPVKSSYNKNGARIDTYQYQIGNEPSAGRAMGHAAMDVLTFGVWELVGSPIEGFQGESYEMTVTYDSSDVVQNLSSRKIGG